MSDEPRRLTPSERTHEALMQALSRTPRGPEFSGSLTLNAKGDVQIVWEAKGDDPAVVLEALQSGFDVLRKRYPRENGGEAKAAPRENGATT